VGKDVTFQCKELYAKALPAPSFGGEVLQIPACPALQSLALHSGVYGGRFPILSSLNILGKFQAVVEATMLV
jgi:hypothetical protein